jgi:hypothetical protein
MHPYSGGAWQQLRARWAQLLPVPCARCGELVHPGEPWDLDHVVPLALGGRADTARPAHQDCNRRAGVETREQVKAAGVAALRDDLIRHVGDPTDRQDAGGQRLPEG